MIDVIKMVACRSHRCRRRPQNQVVLREVEFLSALWRFDLKCGSASIAVSSSAESFSLQNIVPNWLVVIPRSFCCYVIA